MIKVILCALNEEQNLRQLIEDLAKQFALLQQKFEIIICIDGSSDNSYSLLCDLQKLYPLKILSLKNQRGLGLSRNRVYCEAVKNGVTSDDIVIHLDADNSHDPAQIAAMLLHFYQHNLDIVVASRFCDNSTMQGFPLKRQLVSRLVSLFMQNTMALRKISRQKLKDYSSGYRIYRASKIRELYDIYGDKMIVEKDFSSTCEVICKLGKLNAKIDEIPIQYDYSKKLGGSKLRIIRNACQLALLVVKLKLKN